MAVQMALAAAPTVRRALDEPRRLLTGEGLVYSVRGNLNIPSGLDLEDAIFVQRDDPANVSTLRTDPTPGATTTHIRMRRIKIVVGRDPTQGERGLNFGVEIRNAEDVVLEDVEVTGSRKCVGLFVVFSQNVQIVRPYIHDMFWQDDSASIEQIYGIEIDRCVNVDVVEPFIQNLGRTEPQPSGPPRITNWQTDGIAIQGSRLFRVLGGVIDNCGECIDITGAAPQEHFLIHGVFVSDADYAGIKIVNSARQGVVSSCVARTCLVAFVVAGPDIVAACQGAEVRDIRISGCMAIDTGTVDTVTSSLGIPGIGFHVLNQKQDPRYPLRVLFTDCVAQNRDGARKVEFGFREDDCLVPGRENRALNCRVINAETDHIGIGWISVFDEGATWPTNPWKCPMPPCCPPITGLQCP
ncbi:MAG: hypothetical protein AAF628_20570 [Planctomycetota bacterium]